MNNFLNSIFGKSLRWILFLPIALAGLLVVKLTIASLRYDAWSEYMIEIIPTHIISNGVSFYAAVMIAYYVVPHFKKNIAIIFASILIISLTIASIVLFDSISFLPNSGDIDEISLLGIISCIIGAAVGIFVCKDYESQN